MSQSSDPTLLGKAIIYFARQFRLPTYKDGDELCFPIVPVNIDSCMMASREDIATSITDAAGGGIEGPFTVLDHESPDMREWLAAKEELYQAARNVVITGPFSNSASSETRRLHQEASMKFSIKTMHLLRICEAQAKMVDVPGKVYEEKLEVSTMIMESMIIQENEKHLRMQQKAMQIVLRALQAECSALQKSNQGRP